MKRKIKCYLAYTTPLYRVLGLVLIPCAFWLLCALLLWHRYGGIMGAGTSGSEMYCLVFALGTYVSLYEIFSDYWMLGGCLSEAGRGLRYFRTSHRGAEVLGNIVSVDLMRRFLYCMVFSGIVFLFTGWKTAVVMGIAMYCVIVGVLNGSRHIDGLQGITGIAILAQVGLTFVNLANVFLIELVGTGGEVMLVCLAALYCLTALFVSRITVRRITARVRK